jgi:glycosyltransferase involved in cell wall biosynthesis
MKLGVANKETWIFLEDIFAYLSHQYPTEVFQLPARWPLPLLRDKTSHYMLRRSLKNFIQRQDVVLFEWASELVVEASDLHTAKAAALVVRLHRYEMFEWVERIKWEAISYVILDTEAMRQKLLERTSVAPERAIVLPNAVPLARTSAEYRPFQGNIGILANLHPRKRIYELILAFYAAQKKWPDLTLHIGGPERPQFRAYYEALHDLVRRLGLNDKVIFYGRIEDRWAWYQQMDIFVSYSYSEGMQVAPIEAAASGCYCLTHWWEGADEIFPRPQISITEAEFVQQVLDYASTTDEQRQHMRRPFIDYVENFCDLDRINSEIEAVLQKAAAERQHVSRLEQSEPLEFRGV